jgi:thiol-disulfide isomerase/thioredoxin
MPRRGLLVAIAAAAAAAALVAGILVARGTGPASVTRASPGGEAVSLSGVDPVTDRPVSLTHYAGMPVVLNIWASWCTGCREEARDLAAFADSHPEAQVVGLDTQDTDGDARAFYRDFGWSHPSIRDPDGSIAARLGLQGLPTTLFLDRRHRIVTKIIGATNVDGFEEGLRAAKET